MPDDETRHHPSSLKSLSLRPNEATTTHGGATSGGATNDGATDGDATNGDIDATTSIPWYRYTVRDLVIDEQNPVSFHPDIDKERRIAAYEFTEKNTFIPRNCQPGPYRLTITVKGNRLTFSVHLLDDSPQLTTQLSLTPLKKHLKDYGVVCHHYFDAIRHAAQSRIEAIDMGRRALHDEAANIILERLNGKIETDFDTARRLFTLIFSLYHRP